MKRFKNYVKRITVGGLSGLLAITLFAGCGQSSAGNTGSATETAGSGSTADTEDVQTIIVGTGNAYEPYCYLDDDGNLAGYEYEVLKAVDELLPQYEFEYQTSEFKNVLVALDAGQVDIAAHQYETNPEREEKYLFGTESYTTYITYPIVLVDRDDITTLDDLQGKTVEINVGSNSQYYIDEYNEEHADNPIDVVNLDSPSTETVVTGLLEGSWDAVFWTKRDMVSRNEEYGDGMDIFKNIDEPLQTSSTYWLYRKDETELQEAVDGALKELKDSGRLSEISIEVLGDDYTESE